MATSCLPYEPGQSHLLPPTPEEWLPEGHLAYFIGDTVDALDLSRFPARYAGGEPRNRPFHPAMMVKVLLYDCATGVLSSRKLAKKLHEVEAQLQAQIAALLERARQADAAEASQAELAIPAEIARREQRLEVIRATKERVEMIVCRSCSRASRRVWGSGRKRHWPIRDFAVSRSSRS